MTPRARRALSHLIFLLILIAAAWLRLSGSYWGDQGMHPDERGIYMRMERLESAYQPDVDDRDPASPAHALLRERREAEAAARVAAATGTTAEAAGPVSAATLTATERMLRSVDVNLKAGVANARDHEDQRGDLNPEHFAYGSLPYYMGMWAADLTEHLYLHSRDVEIIAQARGVTEAQKESARGPVYPHLGWGLFYLGLGTFACFLFLRLYLHPAADPSPAWGIFRRRALLYGATLFLLGVLAEALWLLGALEVGLAVGLGQGESLSLLAWFGLFIFIHILLATSLVRTLLSPHASLADRSWRLLRLACGLVATGVLVGLLLKGSAIAVAANHNLLDLGNYGGYWLVSRPLSAICGILTVLVLYRIGRQFFDAGVALLAAAFLAFTVLHIQLSHYYAFDTVLALFASVAVLYCCHIATRARFSDFVWAGLFIGLAIASKFSAVLLPPLYILAFLISFFLPRPDGIPAWQYGSFGHRLLERTVGFLAGGILCVFVLLVSEPFAFVQDFRGTGALPITSGPRELMPLGSFLNAFLALWIVVCATRMATRGRLLAFLFGGLALGLLLGLSPNAWPFAVLYLAAVAVRYIRERRATEQTPPRHRLGLAGILAGSALGIIVIALTWQAFLGSATVMPSLYGPQSLSVAWDPDQYPYFGSRQFHRDIAEQTAMARGLQFVWTIQYEHTAPLGYQIDNLFKLSMGPPLAILCLVGFGWFLWFALTRWDRASLILAAWLLANVLVIGTFQTKFSRYMAPYLPFLCFAGAVFAAHWCRAIPPLSRRAGGRLLPWMRRLSPASLRQRLRLRPWIRALTVLALVYSAVYAYSFVTTVYHEKHTKVRASEWIYRNIPRNSTVLVEHWDDPVPIPMPGGSPGLYRQIALPLYDDDYPREGDTWRTSTINEAKYRTIARNLEEGEYLTIASRKIYGAVMRQENKRYKLASQYYKLLFAGHLGYEHVATFENPTRLFGIPIEEDRGEESFRVYDHPKISIFRKVRDYSQEELFDLLTRPATPDVAALTMDDIMNAEGRTVYYGDDGERLGRPVWRHQVHYPILRWLLVLLALTAAAAPYLYRVCGGLPDRGLLLAKPVGIILTVWLAWLLSSAHLVAYSGYLLWMVVFLIAAGGWLLVRGRRDGFLAHARRHWKVLAAGELVFLVVFGIFLAIRMMNPDIFHSEKHMDFSFVNATYRTDYFPAKDPWISGFTINYYYWGHVVYASLGMLSGVPPAYAYNLALATAPALTFLAALAIVFALTRRIRYGLLSGFLAVFAGNLLSYLLAARNLAAGGNGRHLPLPWKEYLWAFGDVLKATWQLVAALFTGRLPEGMNPQMLGYDPYLWPAGHFVHYGRPDEPSYPLDLLPGAVASEFPMWTWLYGDLHAHLMVMAFTLTFIGLVLSVFLARGRGTRLFGAGTNWMLGVFLLSLLLGAITVINTWDLPTVCLVMGMAFFFKFLWHREGPFASERTTVAALNRWGITSPGLQRFGIFLKGLGADVVVPVALVIVLGYGFLFWHFHTYFEPRAAGVRLTDRAFTPVISFWKIFGIFLVIIVPFLFFAVLRWARRLTLTGLAALAATVLLVGMAWVTYEPWSAGDIDAPWSWMSRFTPAEGEMGGEAVQESFEPLRSLWGKLPFDREVRDPALFQPEWGLLALLLPLSLINLLLLFRRDWGPRLRFALILSFVGLCIAWGIEVFYIAEGWGGDRQRWNTPFKFHLHVWLLFSLAAPVFLFTALHRNPRHPSRLGILDTVRRRGRTSAGRRGVVESLLAWAWLVVVLLFLGAALAFPVWGAYSVMWGIGARTIEGDRPTLDGLTYLATRGNGRMFPGEYEGVAWFNRNVPGNDSVVMEAAPGYYNDLGRWGVNTGMPSVMGWDHHVGERLHHSEKVPRNRDVHRFYGTESKEECIDIIRKYGIDYIIVGNIERNETGQWPVFEGRRVVTNTEKFREWGDLLDLVFDSSTRETKGLQIYRVRTNLNPLLMTPLEVTIGDAPARPTPRPTPEPTPVPTVAPIVPGQGTNLFQARSGDTAGNLREPRGIAVSPDGRIFVADSFNYRIQIYGPDGSFQNAFGREGTEPGFFREPNDMAVHPAGVLFVADTFNHRVVATSPDGRRANVFAGGLFGPRCVRVGPDENIYVSDTGNHCVRVYNPAGGIVQIFGMVGTAGSEPGLLNHPWGLTFTPEGQLLVMDSVNKRVQVFDQDGGHVRSFPVATGNMPKPDGVIDPTESFLALDEDGRLYVSDSMGGQVLVYSVDGRLLGRICAGGHLDVSVRAPTGIALTPGGDLLIVERGADAVTRIPAADLQQTFTP